MNRRDFIRQLGLGLAAGWVCGQVSWPFPARAADPQVRLALVADSHLRSGAGRLPEAQALARAVAEINALKPAPDLVLCAGDLAHKGRPDALDLGREILSDLVVPLWAVPGEGDYGRGGAAPWIRRFGSPRFSRSWRGVHFLGLATTWHHTPHGPAFTLGMEQLAWLARELAGLEAATPLVIISHAPLARLFHPWQHWTADAPAMAPLLARFRQVLCLHGHVHGAGAGKARVGDQLAIAPYGNGLRQVFRTANRKLQTANRLLLSLPATAWPLPAALQGTPAFVRPGVGPHGCGWTLVTLNGNEATFHPYLWQA
jgi:hypothetical protein